MAERARDYERLLRRLLVLGDCGFDTSMMAGRVDEPDFLEDEWLVAWFGEPLEGYVLDELCAVDLLLSARSTAAASG